MQICSTLFTKRKFQIIFIHEMQDIRFQCEDGEKNKNDYLPVWACQKSWYRDIGSKP